MFCLGKDYLEFLKHYDYYLRLEMKEYVRGNYIEDTMGVEGFLPKGILGEKVIWYFNHDINASQAVAKWNTRAKRVNMDNIAAIMTLHTDEEAYHFTELGIEKKIGIYHKDLKLENIIYCPLWNDENIRYRYGCKWALAANVFMVNSRGVSPVNWIKFLNGEKDYRRF